MKILIKSFYVNEEFHKHSFVVNEVLLINKIQAETHSWTSASISSSLKGDY